MSSPQVAYQKILQLSYIDKFLNEIQMEFRNKYKDDLQVGKISRNFSDFEATFHRVLKETETAYKEEAKAPKWVALNLRVGLGKLSSSALKHGITCVCWDENKETKETFV